MQFTDAKRGYAFGFHKRDGFKCVYCGLDGSTSFDNWLTLEEERLLPVGHPDRDKSEFRVAACRTCNGADNRYFDLLAARGLSIEGKTPNELIDQRKPYVMASRQAYLDFWRERVAGKDAASA